MGSGVRKRERREDGGVVKPMPSIMRERKGIMKEVLNQRKDGG